MFLLAAVMLRYVLAHDKRSLLQSRQLMIQGGKTIANCHGLPATVRVETLLVPCCHRPGIRVVDGAKWCEFSFLPQ